MNTLNFLSNSTENNYQKILENINEMIKSFDDSNTRDALEGILKYNKAGRCITFFGDQKTKVNYLAPTGSNPLLQQKNLTKREIHQKKEEFQHQFQRVAKIKSTIEQDTTIPQVIKDIYIHKITSLEKSFKMFQSALWLEAEKSGYPLSDEQRNHYQQAVVQQQK
ncbi:MAG: hypothetical protein LBG59_06090 [Candidatus Peribacteria bacterium]|jgi:hypothetical protein|nr:hypothetical protein [Candidatus Peribacteria bacterium]